MIVMMIMTMQPKVMGRFTLPRPLWLWMGIDRAMGLRRGNHVRDLGRVKPKRSAPYTRIISRRK